MPAIDSSGNLVTPGVILDAYLRRCFPMAEGRDAPLSWFRPTRRAVITWDRFRVPRSLAKTIRREPFRITRDRAFPRVIAACSQREDTWISRDIEELYCELHELGHAHSVEAWRGDELVGGLYGLSVRACFCGESMFHEAPDAAKICVVHLVERLCARGYRLLDCQQQSPHMARFGAYEVSDARYARLLAEGPICRFD